jgi:hypothetical protein
MRVNRDPSKKNKPPTTFHSQTDGFSFGLNFAYPAKHFFEGIPKVQTHPD